MRDPRILKIHRASFLKDLSNRSKKSHVFSKEIDCFDVYTPGTGPSHWAIIGPAKSDMLKVAASRFISDPPLSRSYPALSQERPSTGIQFLDFKENSGLDKVHMAARYERYASKGDLEMTDDVNSTINYITGANNYNNKVSRGSNDEFVSEIVKLLALEELQQKWVNSLSNGQFRRARIAKALLTKPKLLIIDDPLLGLDPDTSVSVSSSLKQIADEINTAIILGLRVQDPIPEWITHIAVVDHDGIKACGPKDKIQSSKGEVHSSLAESRCDFKLTYSECSGTDVIDPIVEFDNAFVAYRDTSVLSNFTWKIERGSRWRILGGNGTGKTTILSLITADHPQSWRSVVKMDGVMRKPGSGVTYFDTNDAIGISSPELHSLVPPNITFGDLVLNGLVKGIGNSNFTARFRNSDVPPFANELLRHFEEEFAEFWKTPFRDLSISLQKLALFLRALIKNPNILILDEAFSCMDDGMLVKKCHQFLEDLSSVTILSIGHIDWELPPHDYVLHLTGDSKKRYNFLQKI